MPRCKCACNKTRIRRVNLRQSKARTRRRACGRADGPPTARRQSHNISEYYKQRHFETTTNFHSQYNEEKTHNVLRHKWTDYIQAHHYNTAPRHATERQSNAHASAVMREPTRGFRFCVARMRIVKKKNRPKPKPPKQTTHGNVCPVVQRSLRHGRDSAITPTYPCY